MGAFNVATQPVQIVRPEAGQTLYYRLAVTNAAAVLSSLFPGGVLPVFTNPRFTNGRFGITGVILSSEIDPGTTLIRYTDDGSAATIAKGFAVPGQPFSTRIMAHPDDISVIGAVAGPTQVQACLILGAVHRGEF